MLIARSGSAACVLNGSIYVIGKPTFGKSYMKNVPGDISSVKAPQDFITSVKEGILYVVFVCKGAFTIGARLEAIKKSYDTQNSV